MYLTYALDLTVGFLNLLGLTREQGNVLHMRILFPYSLLRTHKLCLPGGFLVWGTVPPKKRKTTQMEVSENSGTSKGSKDLYRS